MSFDMWQRMGISSLKLGILSILFPLALIAESPAEKSFKETPLVEVTRVFQDDSGYPFPSATTWFISSGSCGMISVDPQWSTKKWKVSVDRTEERATACLTILNTLSGSENFPRTSLDIAFDYVEVKCIDGDHWVVKRFPASAVPVGIRRILFEMGFPEENFSNMKFTNK